jgi:hypothetical protein
MSLGKTRPRRVEVLTHTMGKTGAIVLLLDQIWFKGGGSGTWTGRLL